MRNLEAPVIKALRAIHAHDCRCEACVAYRFAQMDAEARNAIIAALETDPAKSAAFKARFPTTRTYELPEQS